MDVSNALNLLYVDDEPDLVSVVVRSLNLDKAFAVRAVLSGADAIAIVRDGVWRPDVVLLDVTMPDLDGPETFDHLRALLGDVIPIIFFTARTQSDQVRQLMMRGAAGVLVKPFDPLSLARDVRMLATRWRDLDHDARKASIADR